MAHFSKRLILSILVINLFALPVILLVAKNQQDSGTRASGPTENLTIGAESDVTQDIPDEVSNSYIEEQTVDSQVEVQEKSLAQTRTLAAPSNDTPTNNKLSKEVYGFLFHPFVTSTADNYLQYQYLTTLAYMGVSMQKNGLVSKENGPWRVWNSQAMHTITENAHKNGTKIHLTFVLFNTSKCPTCISELVATPQSRQKAVNTIMDTLKNSPNHVDGANINFEVPHTSDREEFTDFIKRLDAAMNAYNPKWTLVIDTFPSSTSGGGFDLQALSPYVDGFFVESYSLRAYKSTDYAGSFNTAAALNKVAENYLTKVPGRKVILGFPLYTYGWKTADNSLKSKRTGGTGLILYKEVAKDIRSFTVNYDSKQPSAWYSYPVCKNGRTTWRQVYYDNDKAFAAKFNIANNKNLGGVGFWAFNEDQGLMDVWNGIYTAFGDKTKLDKPVKKPGFVMPAATKVDKNCKPGNNLTPTPTKKPTGTVSVTPKPTTKPTANPTPTGTPVPTANPNSPTKIKVTIGLHGIGNTGTNQNPTSNVGNKIPNKKSVNFQFTIFGANSKKIQTVSQALSYNEGQGRYSGNVGISIPATDHYNIYVSAAGYLPVRIDSGITKNAVTTLPTTDLSTGDINGDSSRNLLDWILLQACSNFNATRNTTLCPDSSSKLSNSDLNADGKVDEIDNNLWLIEFRSGASGN